MNQNSLQTIVNFFAPNRSLASIFAPNRSLAAIVALFCSLLILELPNCSSGGGSSSPAPTTTVTPEADPPIFTSGPEAGAPTTNSIPVTATIDQDSTFYALALLALPAGGASPTAARVIKTDGQYVTATAGQAVTITVTATAGENLNANTTYDIFLIASNNNGDSEVRSITARTTEMSLSFIGIPTYRIPTVDTVNISATIDRAGTIYAVAVAYSGTPPTVPSTPTAAQVKAGQDSEGTGVTPAGRSNMMAATAGTAVTIELSDLTATEAYRVFIVAEDDEDPPNLSGVEPLDIPALPAWIPSATLSASVAENTATDTTVTTVMASDPTSAPITRYGITPDLTPDNNPPFAIDNSGEVKTTGAVDYEFTSSYILTLSASNIRGRAAPATLTIAVNNVPDENADGLIEIYTVAQLNAIRYDLNGDGVADATVDEAAYSAAGLGNENCPVAGCIGYELMVDLDLAGIANWVPIAEDTVSDSVVFPPHPGGSGGGTFLTTDFDGTEFSATFEGNGKTISNLTIDSDPKDYLGLFGATSSTAIIKSLGLTSVIIKGRSHIGGLVGRNMGTIEECYVNAASLETTLTPRAGSSLSFASYMGGLVGRHRGDNSIKKSYASGTVGKNTHSRAVGGLVGRIDTASHARVIIGNSYSDADVQGADFVGGLVGDVAISTVKISNSYSRGSVTAAAGASDAGNLVGRSLARAADITSSYWDSSENRATAGAAVGVGLTTEQFQCLSNADITADTGTGLIIDFTAPASCTTADGTFSGWDSNLWDFGDDGTTLHPALKVDFDGDGTATVAEFGSQRN